ncbi:MAG: sulfate transporter CysZ [Halieaceae bacterium]
MQGNFITGAGYFFRGLAMLSQPGIWPFVILPLLANIGFFLLLGGAAYAYVTDLVTLTEEALPHWLSFITWIVAPLLWLTGTLVTGYISTLVVLLLTSPFHALLAEKVEEQRTGQALAGLENIGAALLEIPRGIFRELRKITYYIPLAFAVFISSLIPGVQAAAPLLWFLLGAWMMSLQFLDYPMDNHRLPFREVKSACASRRLSSLGFGGMVAFVTGVPLLNLVVIPAAVIGATLFWCEEFRARQ